MIDNTSLSHAHSREKRITAAQRIANVAIQILLIVILAVLWIACQKSPKRSLRESIQAFDVKCLQPQPNSIISRTQQQEIHLISQYQLELGETANQSEFEFSIVHEVLNPSGQVVQSETIKNEFRIRGGLESVWKWDFPWRFPDDLASGKYQYRIQAALTESASQTRQTQYVKKTTNSVDFFIR